MKVTLNRQLLGIEDILFGKGAVEQVRGGQTVTITKVDLTTLPYDEATGQTIAEYVTEQVDIATDKITNLTVTAESGTPTSVTYNPDTNTMHFVIAAGDMYKATYDTDNDGKVDFAELADIAVGVNLDISNTTPPTTGQLRWNQDEKTVDVGINGVVLQMGQEVLTPCRNNTASTIVQGTACMSTGTIGASGRITVAKADMSVAANAFRLLGVATEDIAPGTDGFITYFGKVRTLDTTAWNEGDVLYLSNTTPGALTNVVPTIGVKQTIARVINKHAVTGTLMVRTLPFNELAYEPKNTNIQTHITDTNNPHGVNAAQVGTYSLTQLDTRNTIMSKAAFNALAAERRANRAGSGFDEVGKHDAGGGNVNDGLWTYPTWANYFKIGRLGGIGSSKTEYPIALVNGVTTKISSVNSSSIDTIVQLPPAPTVLSYEVTLTAEQIAMGVIKHADSSNSGVIVNGKFNTDTSGWVVYQGTNTVSNVSGRIRATNISGNAGIAQSFITVVGKTYVVEGNFYKGTTTVGSAVRIGTSLAGNQNGVITVLDDGRFTVSFVATATTTYFGARTDSTTVGEYIEFDNIAVFPAYAISRSDLVFLETWHEDVSEKGVVHRYGNTQFKGASESAFGTQVTPSAGTPVFSGYGTYSLFGNWQASEALIGNVYIWANMTDAQKKAFVSDPENNCYLDGDKIIQVKYRVRVLHGEDSNSMSKATVQGKATTPSSVVFTAPITTVDAGMYSNSSTTYTYTGTACTIGVASVSRRNQGVYHPVFNQNGTKLASDALPWYSTTISFTSIADCFDSSKLLSASGYIGTTSGRADGLFYDQVHEGDIGDLRMSSQKVEDYNRLTNREFNKLVAGTYRGSEGENVTIFISDTFGVSSYEEGLTGAGHTYLKDATITAVSSWLGAFNAADYFSKYSGYVFNDSGNPVKIVSAYYSAGLVIVVQGDQRSGFSLGARKVAIHYQTTRTKSNTLTHIDIIGSPANYPTAFKQSGVGGVPLIVAEDGTSLLPTGALTAFKLSRKANATPLRVLKSTDSGATWSALAVTTHYTFSTTTNAITFVTAPATTDLIMVTYQTHTNMAVAGANAEVLEIGDVISTLAYENANLVQSVISKVAVGDPGVNKNRAYRIQETSLAENAGGTGKLDSSGSTFPTHNTYALAFLNLPAVKTFPYLTRSNGKARLQLVFKEMKYGSYAVPTTVTAASATYTQNMTYKINIAGCALYGKVVQWIGTTTTSAIDWALYDVSPAGTIYLLSTGVAYTNARLYDGDSWGDDSKFNIVDNVSTTTDTNGATILIGQKYVELPYFINAGE